MDTALTDFITHTRDAREYKRAVAVQMEAQGIAHAVIRQTLHVSAPFISKWKRIYTTEGVAGLRLKHRGGVGKLSASARQDIIRWIQAQAAWDLAALMAYVQEEFGVVYHSPQSYYTLLHAAGLSWQQTQATNPKKTMPPSPPNGRN
jgi:putative transposase